MTVQLSSSSQANLAQLAKMLSTDEATLLERAIAYYTSSLQQEVELQDELKSLDDLSDEAMLNFEKQL